MGHGGGQFGQCRQRNAAFAGFPADVDLQADVERRPVVRSLLAEPFGDPETVDGVDPVEALGNRSGLVGLNGADEMPDQLGQVGERVLLGQRLLQIVFAEGELTRGGGKTDRLGRLGLADRHQGDGAVCETHYTLGLMNTFKNPLHAVGNR